MKKTISLVTALVLIFSLAFTATAATPAVSEAAKLLEAVSAKMEGKSVEVVGSMKMTMKLGEQSTDVTTSIHMLQLPMENGETNMYIEQKSELIPTIKQYFQNGWLYNDVGGTKTRQRTSLADVEAQLGGFDMESISADMLNNATVEDVEGGKRIKITLPGDLMTDMTSTLVEGMAGAGSDVKIGDVTVFFTVGEDGYIKDHRQIFDITMTVQGMPVAASYDAKLRYHGVGMFGDIPGPGNIYDYAIAPVL